MRILIVIALWAALGAQAAGMPTRSVDLDRPGALELLRQEEPSHYAKVIETMDKVQAIPLSEEGLHDLRLEARKPDVTRRQIETSLPAKTRLLVPVDDTEYRITVVYVKNPAKVIPAK